MWEAYKKGFKAWLQLEKSLSNQSVDAYLRDVNKLTDYLLVQKYLKKLLMPDIIRACDVACNPS